jgi:starch-binding outer membrane protein, SusD/RagB family
MKNLRYFFAVFILSMLSSSCEFLDPKPMGWLTEEDVLNHHEWTPGILDQVYYNLYEDFIDGNSEDWTTHLGVLSDYATDNAVTVNSVSRPGTGGWSQEYNRTDTWTLAYSNIRSINYFLENGFDTWYSRDSVRNAELKKRYKGEAYFLRAWLQWLLLRDYGGPSDATGQEMLGFPIITESIDTEIYNTLKRNTYEECVLQIEADCDTAIANLPMQYITTDPITGAINKGRGSGAAALALKSRMFLYAASPAFNRNGDQVKWEKAANAAYDAILATGGLIKLTEFGDFNNTDNDDHIWRSDFRNTNLIELAHFPPSMFGRGECNPAQNLVDAFPMLTGWPISEPLSGYNPEQPYKNRDKRFNSFIWHNGLNKIADKEIELETFAGGADAAGGKRTYGTRTGYYMKKYNADVSLDPAETRQRARTDKFVVFFRKAELYLNFAEAANKAYGNSAAKRPGFTFSAKDALKKVRERGGIFPGTDFYTDILAADPNTFEELVQNERRIEFCFEGHRFYDIRRLMLDMNAPVNGVQIEINEAGEYSYELVEVEQRNYETYMIYGPIPHSEILKNQNIIQNYGWN